MGWSRISNNKNISCRICINNSAQKTFLKLFFCKHHMKEATKKNWYALKALGVTTKDIIKLLKEKLKLNINEKEDIYEPKISKRDIKSESRNSKVGHTKGKPDDDNEANTEPIVKGLLFFRVTEAEAKDICNLLYQKAYIYRHYNKFNKPLVTIPDNEINIFKFMTTSGREGVIPVSESVFKLKADERVRITGGKLKGFEGYIKRINGNKHFIVVVEGFCAIATTNYIPSCFVERVNSIIQKTNN